MGVAIIADVFMESISVITSRSRWIEVDADVRRAVEPESVDMESPKMASKKQIEIRVRRTRSSTLGALRITIRSQLQVIKPPPPPQTWNPTVANLTLMALGSSAPEILLSCIELVRNDFFAGALGASRLHVLVGVRARSSVRRIS